MKTNTTKHSNHPFLFPKCLIQGKAREIFICIIVGQRSRWSIKLNSEPEIPPVSLSLSGSPPPPSYEKHGSIFGTWINIGEYGGNVVLLFFLCILFIITKDTGNQTCCSRKHALYRTHGLSQFLTVTLHNYCRLVTVHSLSKLIQTFDSGWMDVLLLCIFQSILGYCKGVAMWLLGYARWLL